MFEATTSEPITKAAQFVQEELPRLSYGSSVKTASKFYADDLFDVALSEEMTPDNLDALVWAAKSRDIDWPYQFAIADLQGSWSTRRFVPVGSLV